MSEKKLTESIEDDRGVLARRDGAGLPARRGALAHVSAEQIALADKIFIDGLEVFANHGVYEEENKLGQKFVVPRRCIATRAARGGPTIWMHRSITARCATT